MSPCDAILASRVAGETLSPTQEVHAASCARCAATFRALALTRADGANAPPPPVPSPPALRVRARRRVLGQATAVALAAAVIGFLLTRPFAPAPAALATAASATEPDLLGLLDDVASLDENDDAEDPPGTEVLSMLDPLEDPWSDDPFTALMTTPSTTPRSTP